MKRPGWTTLVFLYAVIFLCVPPPFAASQDLEEDFDGEGLYPADKWAWDMKYAPAPQGIVMRADKEIKYVAGKDGQWFTKDDEVYNYFLAEYDSKGKMVKKENYKTGPDKISFTSDDELQDRVDYEYDADGGALREVYSKRVGAGKDTLDYCGIYEHDASGKKTKVVRYNLKGEIARYITYAFGPQGKVVQDVEYAGKGPDGVWFTGDDEIEKYHRREYDTHGNLLRTAEYLVTKQGRGADGIWFTPDDVVSSTREIIYNKDGLVIKTLKGMGPGPDNKWFSDDDVLQYYTVREYIKIR